MVSPISFGKYPFCLPASISLRNPWVLDDQEEQRLRQIRFPIAASQEARMQVADMARDAAIRVVGQYGLQETLASARAHIQAIARAQLAHLTQTAEPEALTDDLEAFKKLYIRMFAYGWRDAVCVRGYILTGSQSYRNDPRWQALYKLCDEQGVE
jgi:CHASE3 domain sensor protein